MFAIINIGNIHCGTLFKAEVIKGGFKSKENAIRFAAKLKFSEWAVVKTKAKRGMVVRVDDYHYTPGVFSERYEKHGQINVSRVFSLNEDFRFIDVILLDSENDFKPFAHHSFEWKSDGELSHDLFVI